MSDLRELERDSIYRFVESCGDLFRGARVLDYGAGAQPYKDLIESFGPKEYVPYDAPNFPASCATADTTGSAWQRRFDVVVCTQVFQYLERPDVELFDIRYHRLSYERSIGDRYLVLTYPTNWPEVEEADLRRFTKSGMGRMLADVGFEIMRHERRAEVTLGGEAFALGYGVVARA